MPDSSEEPDRIKALGLTDPDPVSRQRNYILFLESDQPDKLSLLEQLKTQEKHPKLIQFIEIQIHKLRNRGNQQQISTILKRIQLALQSNDAQVQNKAMQYILKARVLEAYDLVKQIARIRQQPQMKRLAIELAGIMPGRYREDLIEAMRDSDSEIRMLAFQGLIKHQAISSQAYAASLVMDEDAKVSKFVLESLKALRSAELSNLMARMSESEYDIYRRSYLKIQENLTAEFKPKKLESTKPALEDLMRDDFNILNYFTNLLKKSEDVRQLASLVLALGGLQDDPVQIKSILRPYLQHEDHRIRANAVESFIEFAKSEEDVQILIQSSYDANNRVVGNALIGLWKVGNNEKHLNQGIDRLLSRDELSSFKTVCYLLELIRSDDYAEILRGYLCRNDESFRTSPIYKQGMDLLHTLARHSDTYARAVHEVQEYYLSELNENSPSVNQNESESDEDLMHDLLQQLESPAAKAKRHQSSIIQNLSPFCDSCFDHSKPTKLVESDGYDIWSVLQFGSRLLGKSKTCTDCGSIISTLWICFLVPLIPIGSYRILYMRSVKDQIMAMRIVPLSVSQIFVNYLILSMALGSIIFLRKISYAQITPEDYFSAAQQQHKNGNYVEALSLYQKATQEGNALAIYNVGLMNYEGVGTVQNYDEAFRWLKRCLGKNLAVCEHLVGNMYLEQKGGLTEIEKGVVFLLEGEKLGFGPSSFKLYQIYRNGLYGFEKDIVRAMAHLKRGCNQNHTESLARMAWHLLNAEEVEGDMRQGLQYLEEAAIAADPWAMKTLALNLLADNPGTHRLNRALSLLDKVAKIEKSGEAQFLQGKYLIENKLNLDKAWSLIDDAILLGWSEAREFRMNASK